MTQPRSFAVELARFLLLLLLLPVALLLLGPALILAALVGRLPVGPLQLDPGRGGLRRRVTALLVGLVLWIAIWGGLGWLWLRAGLDLPGGPGAPEPVTTSAAAPPTATLSPTAAPLAPASPTPAATPTGTATPTRAAPPPPPPTASPTRAATLTPTPGPDTPRQTPSPTATPAAPDTPPPEPSATLSPDEEAAVLATVERANTLLAAAIASPSEGNLANLANAWRGAGLDKAEAFAQDVYGRYRQPLRVEFRFLEPARIDRAAGDNGPTVATREEWLYTGPTRTEREVLEFTYRLSRAGEGWAIDDYDYTVISLAPPTPTVTLTLTATETITP